MAEHLLARVLREIRERSQAAHAAYETVEDTRGRLSAARRKSHRA